ncbi:MAG: hypothetical protein LBB93_03845 [Elusimicrobiota bacterium]|jgi:hypothetical protein|nr:hypothetical protein [Elusimicrobiota bacterium]
MVLSVPQNRRKAVLKQKLGFLISKTFYFDFSAKALDNAYKIYETLKPMNIEGAKKERIGGEGDGGYVTIISSPPLQPRIAYSFGISTRSPWDLEIAQRGYEVFQYDGTIDKPPDYHPLLKFFKFNIGSGAGQKSVRQILEENGHTDKNIILQCDIEGSEWDVFESIDRDDILVFEQMIIEFHNVYAAGKNFKRQLEVLKKINKTHQVVHIRGNDCGRATVLNNLLFLPESLEVTYIRKYNPATQKPENVFSECFDEFPLKDEAPNDNENICPIYLGSFCGKRDKKVFWLFRWVLIGFLFCGYALFRVLLNDLGKNDR